jgi:DNA-binding response OmpR family regulator
VSVTSAHRKVLIIEDDADIRSLVNLRLRQHSYETAYATDGDDLRWPSRAENSRT